MSSPGPFAVVATKHRVKTTSPEMAVPESRAVECSRHASGWNLEPGQSSRPVPLRSVAESELGSYRLVLAKRLFRRIPRGIGPCSSWLSALG